MEKDIETPLAPEGMTHADFRIGTEFRCAGAVWRCTDIGTRTVVAIRMDQVEIGSASGGLRILTRQEAEQDGWFTGPPYAVAERVFDEDDFPVCTLVAPPECSDGTALPPDLSAAGADMLANELAQRLGIDSDRAIHLAVISYLRRLDSGDTLSQRVAHAQVQARKAGIGAGLTDHKTLTDDMWGEA
ncbi:MAG TPA: hypothetical protein VGC14_15535 [Rhizobium sp.]